MAQVDFEPVAIEIKVEGSFKVLFHPDLRIVEVEWDEKLESVEIETMIKLREIMFNLGNGEKLPIYISTKPFMNISEEAKRFVATEEGQKYTLANAVLVDNLAKRILYNFFIKFYTLPNPNKAFKSKEEAFIWLKSL
jgi:hypothetical protein